jgi:hypothetical protein
VQPSSSELMARIAAALEEQVMPALGDDRWAASALRSAATLLAHLERRVTLEVPILLADNDDAAATLQRIQALPQPSAANPAVYAEIADLLAEPAVTPAYDVAALQARNRHYQAVMDKLLRDCHVDGHMHAVHAELRAYFKRRLARESDLYFPIFTAGAPF